LLRSLPRPRSLQLLRAGNFHSWAATVFIRTGSTWTEEGPTLPDSGETGFGGFGTSVALTSDGKTALIGVPGDDTRP
jgi:hypothetical protein